MGKVKIGFLKRFGLIWRWSIRAALIMIFCAISSGLIMVYILKITDLTATYTIIVSGIAAFVLYFVVENSKLAKLGYEEYMIKYKKDRANERQRNLESKVNNMESKISNYNYRQALHGDYTNKYL